MPSRASEAESPCELGVGPADGIFRIGIDMAGKICGTEKKIADFLDDRGGIPGVERGLDFIGLSRIFR